MSECFFFCSWKASAISKKSTFCQTKLKCVHWDTRAYLVSMHVHQRLENLQSNDKKWERKMKQNMHYYKNFTVSFSERHLSIDSIVMRRMWMVVFTLSSCTFSFLLSIFATLSQKSNRWASISIIQWIIFKSHVHKFVGEHNTTMKLKKKEDENNNNNTRVNLFCFVCWIKRVVILRAYFVLPR